MFVSCDPGRCDRHEIACEQNRGRRACHSTKNRTYRDFFSTRNFACKRRVQLIRTMARLWYMITADRRQSYATKRRGRETKSMVRNETVFATFWRTSEQGKKVLVSKRYRHDVQQLGWKLRYCRFVCERLVPFLEPDDISSRAKQCCALT